MADTLKTRTRHEAPQPANAAAALIATVEATLRELHAGNPELPLVMIDSACWIGISASTAWAASTTAQAATTLLDVLSWHVQADPEQTQVVYLQDDTEQRRQLVATAWVAAGRCLHADPARGGYDA